MLKTEGLFPSLTLKEALATHERSGEPLEETLRKAWLEEANGDATAAMRFAARDFSLAVTRMAYLGRVIDELEKTAGGRGYGRGR